MEIKIVKNNIYDYALALTARAGAATDAYAQIAITKDNYPMLDVYLSEAVTQAESVLRKKLTDSNAVDMRIDDAQVIIQTKEQHMGDVAVYPLIESSVRLYMAYHIAASWLQASPGSSLGDVYGATSATHLQTAVSALNQRTEPKIDDSDYGERAADVCRMAAQQAGSYGSRKEDVCRMAAQQTADYGMRSGDNVKARPGARIANQEMLLIQTGDGETMEPAITCNGEILT